MRQMVFPLVALLAISAASPSSPADTPEVEKYSIAGVATDVRPCPPDLKGIEASVAKIKQRPDPEMAIYVNFPEVPVAVGKTHDGKPVRIGYDSGRHLRYVMAGDRCIAASQELTFCVKDGDDVVFHAAAGELAEYGELGISTADITVWLTTSDPDFESKLAAAIAPQEGFSREEYIYSVNSNLGGEFPAKSHTRITADMPTDKSLQNVCLPLLFRDATVSYELSDNPIDADGMIIFNLITFFPDTEPVSLFEIVRARQAGEISRNNDSKLLPAGLTFENTRIFNSLQYSPVLATPAAITYKVSHHSSYPDGGGFRTSIYYISADRDSGQTLTTADIFPTISKEVKEAYFEEALKFMTAYWMPYNITSDADRRNYALDRLISGEDSPEPTSRDINDVKLPDEAALTDGGVMVRLSSECFSDFGEMADEYLLLPWESIAGYVAPRFRKAAGNS